MIQICHNTKLYSKTVNTRQKHIKWSTCRESPFEEKHLKWYYIYHHLHFLSEGLFPKKIPPAASWNHHEPLSFNFGRCTWLAIIIWSLINLPTNNVPSVPPLTEPPDEVPISSPQPNLTCFSDSVKNKPKWKIVGVGIVGGKVYSIPTGWWEKNWKHSEQWSPCHPFWSTHYLQQVQLFIQHMKYWLISIHTIDRTDSKSHYTN